MGLVSSTLPSEDSEVCTAVLVDNTFTVSVTAPGSRVTSTVRTSPTLSSLPCVVNFLNPGSVTVMVYDPSGRPSNVNCP